MRLPPLARRARETVRRRAPVVDDFLVRLDRARRGRPLPAEGLEQDEREAIAALMKLSRGATASSKALDKTVTNASRALAGADLARRRRSPVVRKAHECDHVLAELRLWAPIVSAGSYVVVEDTHADGHPITTRFGPGPGDAVELFLAETDSFQVDPSKHKYFFTWNRRGYLKRVS